MCPQLQCGLIATIQVPLVVRQAGEGQRGSNSRLNVQHLHYPLWIVKQPRGEAFPEEYVRAAGKVIRDLPKDESAASEQAKNTK